MMSITDSHETERGEHPLDMVERLAHLKDLTFERSGDDEIAISVQGRWTSYDVAFTWLEGIEALHVACAFDLKIPERRRSEIADLMTRINEQLWIGHFDMWSETDVVMFRHSLMLSGGVEPSGAQCEALMNLAVDTCDRHYQAFQFVMWSGKSPVDALAVTMFETVGEA
ncbi:MAG: YbjN domain-containing protein [Hyphomicrobiales bacterium]|jgi:hypothetical protein